MITTGHINFFTVAECGLYKHDDDNAYGLLLPETLKLIEGWVAGKLLGDTLPWDPSESKRGMAKCYCRDLYCDDGTGDYFFVLWKSDTGTAGSILGAEEQAATGQGKVVEYGDQYRGRKMIWGRPCYYWFIPRLNLIASIKFDHSACDSSLMQEWFTKAITNRVSHPKKKIERTPAGQVRFEFNDRNHPGRRFAYRFDVRLKLEDTATTQLQNLANSVTHIIRRETIRLDTPNDERARWVRLFDKLDYVNPAPKAKSRQIEVRAEAKPSVAELRAIIEQFSKDDRKPRDWDNVGFVTNEGKLVWVDRYRVHSAVNFNRDEGTVFSAIELFERLSRSRTQLLRLVQNAGSTRVAVG
jgi:hypothetical protein